MESIALRRWEKPDAAAAAHNANNPNLGATLSDRWTTPYTLEQAHAFVDAMLGVDEKQNYQRVILVGGEVAGSVGIMRLTDIHRLTAEVGYWIGEPYWGRGIMTRALAMAIEEVRQLFPDVIRLQAETFSSNPGSSRVLEKNGFVREGILRSKVIKAGKIMDAWGYGRVWER